MTMTSITRRRFLKQTSAAIGGVAALHVKKGQAAKASASERLQAGMIGAGGRAATLNRLFAANPFIDVVAIADVDLRRLPETVAAVASLQGHKPRSTQDFRGLIDDPKIDVLCVGTPDHWHALPTILGCMAGKDVYVEKPDAHNIVEGQRMIAAMRKHNRIVQVGSQHRSTARLQSALAYIREGRLGRCLVAKAWESTKQRSIGFPPDGTPPPEVDYDMWLGPAPKRPFNPNRFHGTWRWFYDYGTGDLGNDGVHRLDMAFAALSAAVEAEGGQPLRLPAKISATGGKWYFDDAQEFPDTLQVNYEYPGKPARLLTYEMRIWAPYHYLGESEAAAVFGDQGYLVIGNNGWRAYTSGGKLVKEMPGNSDAAPHVQDFVECVKARNRRPVCDLETVGHPASVLCHAGNIAARVGRTLRLDPQNETFIGDAEANSLRGRPEWRKPWILPEV
jgi:predicted dehydrogenase